MLRRIHVKTDDVRGLFLKSRIVRSHVTIQAVRLQACLRPHALHGGLADAERFGHLAARPVRAAVGRSLLRPARDARLHLGGRDARLAAFVAWIEARDSVLLEAPFPTRD